MRNKQEVQVGIPVSFVRLAGRPSPVSFWVKKSGEKRP